MVALTDAVYVLYPLAIPLIDWRVQNDGGGALLVYWDTAALGPQPSQATLDAVTQAQVDAARATKEHTALVGLLSVSDRPAKLVRVLMAIIRDELNLHALKINAMLDAADNAAAFAAFKTAMAAIPDYPQRTIANLVTALTNKINAGDVD